MNEHGKEEKRDLFYFLKRGKSNSDGGYYYQEEGNAKCPKCKQVEPVFRLVHIIDLRPSLGLHCAGCGKLSVACSFIEEEKIK